MINVGDKAPEILGINEKGVPRKRVICATTTPNYAKSAMK